jgi:hypothetical protein
MTAREIAKKALATANIIKSPDKDALADLTGSIPA